MKTKLLFICALFFTMGQSFAQVYLFEPFDYTPLGNSLLTPAVNTNPGTSTIWNNYTGGSPEDMTIEEGPATGWTLGQAFDLNPTGNAVHWAGGGEDGEIKFATEAAPVDTGSVYLSFFIHVRGWPTGSTPSIYRHIGFGINDNGNNGSSLFFGPGSTAGTFQLGYGNSDSQNTTNPDVVFIPTDYTYVDIGVDADDSNAKQFFIVIKYTFGVGGGSPDGAMWVNPSVSTTEPTPDITHTATNKVRSTFISVLLQASSNARNPDNYVDEIRVAGSWEEATGQPPLSVSENELDNSIKLYPNPAQDVINIESKSIRLSSVDVYNVLGAKVLSSGLTNDSVNVSNLVKGVYFMKINAEEGGSLTKRVVIK